MRADVFYVEGRVKNVAQHRAADSIRGVEFFYICILLRDSGSIGKHSTHTIRGASSDRLSSHRSR
jgi:hypothetical protein